MPRIKTEAVAAVSVLVLGLVVVASSGSRAWAQPTGQLRWSARLLAIVVAAGLGLLWLAVIARVLARTGWSARLPELNRAALVFFAGTVAAVVAGAGLYAQFSHDATRRGPGLVLRGKGPPDWRNAVLLGGGAKLRKAHGRVDVAAHTVAWSAGGAALALLVLGILIATRQRRSRVDPTPDVSEAVAASADEAIDDLRREPDVRAAIIAAYARMERVLAACGVERHFHETPFEYLERALRGLELEDDLMQQLTQLFELAKFSTRPLGEAEREQAIEALIGLRQELRAPAASAAPVAAAA